MAIPDQQYRLGVMGGGAVLVVTMALMRFCGSVSLPPKPPPPAPPPGETARQLMGKANAQAPVYEQYLREDASAASFNAPSLSEMSRKLPYHSDESVRVLALDSPIEVAGLRLKLTPSGESIVLEVENMLPSAVAYRVDTDTSLGSVCNSARPLPFDAMVLHKGTKETRVECVLRKDITIRVTRVETLELTPLMAYYVGHVPPSLVGIEDRIARGHHPSFDVCQTTISQSIRSGIENKEIGWRDLIDFFARHSCQHYQFPVSYRAFSKDDERMLPAVDARM